MDIEKLKADLRKRIGKGNKEIQHVLDILSSDGKLLTDDQVEELTVIKAGWNKYKRKERMNLFYPGEGEVAYGRLVDSLLGFIGSLNQKPETDTPIPTETKTILFLAANPEQSSFLRLDKEYREIAESLKKSHNREQFSIELRLATRPSDLNEAVLEHKPWMIHFAGHGELKKKENGGKTTNNEGTRGLSWNQDKEENNYDSGIILMDDATEEPKLVSNQALGEYFSHFKSSLEGVFLNSCYSAIQAEAIHAHIDYVIGMDKAVGDPLAIAFSTAFYEAIFAGQQIKEAFLIAKAYLGIIEKAGIDIPKILSRS